MKHVYSGKVRDLYDAGEGLLLFVASDRMSAFDVVMPEHVPDKGRVLTAMSAFWFDELADVVPSHVVATEIDDCPPEWVGRIMLVREA
ncbi:MAG TPA: phosphoribosylaminoimidazolesuccinocarboxamide synthase, partial [Acidimicrobiales bacterium]